MIFSVLLSAGALTELPTEPSTIETPASRTIRALPAKSRVIALPRSRGRVFVISGPDGRTVGLSQ